MNEERGRGGGMTDDSMHRATEPGSACGCGTPGHKDYGSPASS